MEALYIAQQRPGLDFAGRKQKEIGADRVRTTEAVYDGGGTMSDDEECGTGRTGRARTYLANERTFLAWFRTAVTLVALGLAAAQFLARRVVPGVPLARSIAIALICSGAFVMLAGARRYQRATQQIRAGAYEPAGYSVAVMTALLLFVVVLAIVFALAIA
jgi:putative membrane protein